MTAAADPMLELSRYLYLAGALPFLAAYLWLARRYWFRTPFIGCLLAAMLFLASWITRMMGS